MKNYAYWRLFEFHLTSEATRPSKQHQKIFYLITEVEMSVRNSHLLPPRAGLHFSVSDTILIFQLKFSMYL